MTDQQLAELEVLLSFAIGGADAILDRPEVNTNGRWLMMARRAQESLHALTQAIGACDVESKR